VLGEMAKVTVGRARAGAPLNAVAADVRLAGGVPRMVELLRAALDGALPSEGNRFARKLWIVEALSAFLVLDEEARPAALAAGAAPLLARIVSGVSPGLRNPNADGRLMSALSALAMLGAVPQRGRAALAAQPGLAGTAARILGAGLDGWLQAAPANRRDVVMSGAASVLGAMLQSRDAVGTAAASEVAAAGGALSLVRFGGRPSPSKERACGTRAPVFIAKAPVDGLWGELLACTLHREHTRQRHPLLTPRVLRCTAAPDSISNDNAPPPRPASARLLIAGPHDARARTRPSRDRRRRARAARRGPRGPALGRRRGGAVAAGGGVGRPRQTGTLCRPRCLGPRRSAGPGALGAASRRRGWAADPLRSGRVRNCTASVHRVRGGGGAGAAAEGVRRVPRPRALVRHRVPEGQLAGPQARLPPAHGGRRAIGCRHPTPHPPRSTCVHACCKRSAVGALPSLVYVT
jgi:hypothetical protein